LRSRLILHRDGSFFVSLSPESPGPATIATIPFDSKGNSIYSEAVEIRWEAGRQIETGIINQRGGGSGIQKERSITMDPKQIAKQMIQFSRTTFDNTFDAITVLQEQADKLIGAYLEQAPMIPAEGKKAITDWMKAYKKGREEFKTAVDDHYKKVEETYRGYDKGGKSETVAEPKAVEVRPAKKAIKAPKAVKAIPAPKKPKTAKPRPAEKVKKTAKKKPLAKKITNIDQVVGLIQSSTKGISTAELKEKTGLAESQIWNIVNHASKPGKVRKIKRGVYGAA
jgi:polyhydroxyalkanoate synthesis regulator phasin/predicted DNA-binding transcriptional regulator AlpA